MPNSTAQLAVNLTLLVCLQSACSGGYSQRAPEVLYSSAGSDNRHLQVPPDLTDISDGEQFVLPGSSSGAVTRNTLLPQFKNATLRRAGAIRWLEISATAESIWPELLRFLRQEKLTILRTQPVSGLIETEWQPAVSDSGGSVLKNLIGAGDGDTLYQRVALRMERGESLTRLFVQVQQIDKASALAVGANQRAWPGFKPSGFTAEGIPAEGNLEQGSVLLQRLLVHFGVSAQRAKGLLDDASAGLMFDSATLQRTAGGVQLLLHRGYRQSFRSLLQSLASLGLQVTSSDITVGEIQFSEPGQSDGSDARTGLSRYSFRLKPVHVSAVTVIMRDALGQPLVGDVADKLLTRIRDALV